jgi:hypothetical protein
MHYAANKESAMTPTDPILTTVTAAAGCAYFMQLLQKAKSISWITAHTTGINVALRAALSFGSTIGISHAWTPANGGGGSFTLVFPPLAVIAIGLWHWFGQYAIQHGFGQLLSVGTLKSVDTPVQINPQEPKA